MGIISGLRKALGSKQDSPSMSQLAEQRRQEEEKAQELWALECEIEWKILQEARVPPFMAAPGIDMTPFPFDNREYVCESHLRIDRETGEVFEESCSFYADGDAVKAVEGDIDMLEALIDVVRDELPTLPWLRVATERFDPVVVAEDKSFRNAVSLRVEPLTPTGKQPRYPVSVSFSAYEQIADKYGYAVQGENGAHGRIFYLANGEVGKAEFNYWDGGVHYRVAFKMIKGMLAVSAIRYNDNPMSEPVTIFSKG